MATNLISDPVVVRRTPTGIYHCSSRAPTGAGALQYFAP
jgi:hypothetical protein